jgi:putative hemolysin
MKIPTATPRLFSLEKYLPEGLVGRCLRPLSPVIEQALGLSTMNQWYDQVRLYPEKPFVDLGLETMGVRYDVSIGDLERIPSKGPVVAMANHCFGLLDPMILISVLSRARPDIRIMTNHMLSIIPELRNSCIFVDPFGGQDSARKNLAPLRESLQWLKSGGLLLVFPAGEVASFCLKARKVVEPQWNDIVAGLIRKTSAHTLPVFTRGTNGILFHSAGLIHPLLRTMLLPRELVNKRDKVIHVSVGKPIPATRIAMFDCDKSAVSYLRDRTMNLRLRRQRGPKLRAPINSTHRLIISAREQSDLCANIARLGEANLLAESQEYQVFVAQAGELRTILPEIGRLRELTFRAVGEGTGRAFDLDEFDKHYLHLFVWNRERSELVGSYRLGRTDNILAEQGPKGLYTSTLFRLHPRLLSRLNPALELGRSFVREEYQRTTAALALLWKGIGTYVARNPRYNLLFGPVSISADYRPASQRMMIDFLRENRFESESALWIKPRRQVRLPRGGVKIGDDLDEVNGWVSDLEADGKGIPILIRQYLNLGGRMLSFNVDQSFNNAVDALILVDLLRTDPRLLNRYLGRSGLETFMQHHGATARAVA